MRYPEILAIEPKPSDYAYEVITTEEAVREIEALTTADRESRALAQLDADARALAETEPATPSPAAESEAQPAPVRPHYSPARSDVRSGDVATCREAERMNRLRGCPRPMGA